MTLQFKRTPTYPGDYPRNPQMKGIPSYAGWGSGVCSRGMACWKFLRIYRNIPYNQTSRYWRAHSKKLTLSRKKEQKPSSQLYIQQLGNSGESFGCKLGTSTSCGQLVWSESTDEITRAPWTYADFMGRNLHRNHGKIMPSTMFYCIVFVGARYFAI